MGRPSFPRRTHRTRRRDGRMRGGPPHGVQLPRRGCPRFTISRSDPSWPAMKDRARRPLNITPFDAVFVACTYTVIRLGLELIESTPDWASAGSSSSAVAFAMLALVLLGSGGHRGAPVKMSQVRISTVKGRLRRYRCCNCTRWLGPIRRSPCPYALRNPSAVKAGLTTGRCEWWWAA